MDSADQNQKHSHDDLTDPHRSQAIEVCENDDIPIESGQFISHNSTKKVKRKIDKVYEDQCIKGDVTPVITKSVYLIRCKHTEIKSKCSNRCFR